MRERETERERERDRDRDRDRETEREREREGGERERSRRNTFCQHTVQFSSRGYLSYVLRKAYIMHSTLSLRSFPNVAFEIVPANNKR